MKPLAKLALLFACAAITSCADNNTPRLVDAGVASKLDRPAKIPTHFAVTPQEARLAVPFTKYNWSIYADRSHYYLLSDLDGSKIRTAEVIRQYGYPLSATTRYDIDRILQLRAKNSTSHTPTLSIQQLSSTLPRKHQPTP